MLEISLYNIHPLKCILYNWVHYLYFCSINKFKHYVFLTSQNEVKLTINWNDFYNSCQQTYYLRKSKQMQWTLIRSFHTPHKRNMLDPTLKLRIAIYNIHPLMCILYNWVHYLYFCSITKFKYYVFLTIQNAVGLTINWKIKTLYFFQLFEFSKLIGFYVLSIISWIEIL